MTTAPTIYGSPDAARLFEVEARDLQRGGYPPMEKVLVRAETRSEAFAILRANDFDPYLDREDHGGEFPFSDGPPVSMGAAARRELPLL